jgi:hypothetical protein
VLSPFLQFALGEHHGGMFRGALLEGGQVKDIV